MKKIFLAALIVASTFQVAMALELPISYLEKNKKCKSLKARMFACKTNEKVNQMVLIERNDRGLQFQVSSNQDITYIWKSIASNLDLTMFFSSKQLEQVSANLESEIRKNLSSDSENKKDLIICFEGDEVKCNFDVTIIRKKPRVKIFIFSDIKSVY